MKGEVQEQTYGEENTALGTPNRQVFLMRDLGDAIAELGDLEEAKGIFARIQELNIDLDKENIALQKTREELTGARLRLEVFERAKARVISVINREAERSKKVSPMDFILILSVAFLLGILFNLSNPAGVDLMPLTWSNKSSPDIDVHWAKLKYDKESSLFVDARPFEFFKERHLRGAINLPPTLFDFIYKMKFSKLDPKEEIIVYGRNVSRLYDEEVAFKLASRGHENVKVLLGGLPAWGESGYPVEP